MAKFRNELKFICTSSQIALIDNQLSSVLGVDENAGPDGRYTVSSLYFDDYRNSCVADNDSGVGNRAKYRIRVYDDKMDSIRLEKKMKRSTLSMKTSSALTFYQYELLLNGEMTFDYADAADALLKEFTTIINSRRYRPKVVVQYERKAFVDVPSNVRITLDTNISASPETESLGDRYKPLFPVLERDIHLLEVKFDNVLPGYIGQIMKTNRLKQSTFSKYYMAHQTISKCRGYI